MPRLSPTWCGLVSTPISWVASRRQSSADNRQIRRQIRRQTIDDDATGNIKKPSVYGTKPRSKRCSVLLRHRQTRRQTAVGDAVILLPFFLLLLRNSEERKQGKRNKPARAERGCSPAPSSHRPHGNSHAMKDSRTRKLPRCGASSSTFGWVCLVSAGSSATGWRRGATACAT